MPAENIIAIHDDVRNSGSSSSRPSGMFPNLPSASQSEKTTKPEAIRTKNQSRPAIVSDSASVEAAESEAVFRNPQRRKPMAMTAVTPKTTLSTGRSLVDSSLKR